MKIAFYLHHTAIKAGGIFTYSMGVLKLLLKSERIKKIVLVYSGEQEKYLKEYLAHPKIEPLKIDRGSVKVKLPLMLSYFLYDVYFLYKDQLGNSKWPGRIKALSAKLNPYKKVVSAGAKLLQVPMQFSPVYNLDIPVITTMHDVQELHYPEFFDSAERLHRAINSKKAVEESEHVIVSFDHVKKDLLKFFGVDDKKVSVCPPEIGASWFGTENFTEKETLLGKYNLPEKFILYPAATWKHKNHINLLKAIKQLKDKGKEVFLVSTGNRTEYFAELKNYILQNNLENNSAFPGIVPEEDLIGLYKAARAVVIPTLYEAGSGPMFEAMRYGTPVICSNITSLPDTMDNPDYLFDPENIVEIADKTERITQDREYRAANLKNSERRLAFFASIDYAGNFVKVFESVIKK